MDAVRRSLEIGTASSLAGDACKKRSSLPWRVAESCRSAFGRDMNEADIPSALSDFLQDRSSLSLSLLLLPIEKLHLQPTPEDRHQLSRLANGNQI
ncbi:MAG: hypothetical protein ACRYG8_47290 [Janthinobacterium lividum]